MTHSHRVKHSTIDFFTITSYPLYLSVTLKLTMIGFVIEENWDLGYQVLIQETTKFVPGAVAVNIGQFLSMRG